MKYRKGLTAVTLSAAMVAAGFMGSDFLRTPSAANAQEPVQTSPEQLSKVQDLATVFKNVDKVVEPAVVKIDVRKTIKNPNRGNNDMLRRFFRHQLPDNNGGDDNNDNGGDDNTPDIPGMPGDQGGGDMEQQGVGSGVIMEVDGSDAYVVTNNHVAGNADELTITLQDGRQISDGKVLGADARSDLAVVKIHADHLTPVKWGNSDEMEKGDFVLAFGSPFDQVGTMTHGIVSALHRAPRILGELGMEDFIQTDAPINPGNSGGPLVNMHAELVGINTAILSRSGGFQGIGFVIPSNEVKFVYQQLKDHGKVSRGYLGVGIQDFSQAPGVAESFGYKKPNGVLVGQVMPNSPANGKLQEGDIIEAINGKEVVNTTDLRSRIAMTPPGTTVEFKVYRNGTETTVPVKLGEQPASLAALRGGNNNAGEGGNAATTTLQSYGLSLVGVDDPIAQRLNLPEGTKGAVVTKVAPLSSAERAGLRPGDVISKVNNQQMTSPQDVSNALNAAKGKGVRLYVTTADGGHFAFLPAPKKMPSQTQPQ